MLEENCEWKLELRTCLSHGALTQFLHSYNSTQQHHASTPTFLEQQQQPRPCLYYLVHLLFSLKTPFSIPNPNYISNALPPQLAALVLLYPLFPFMGFHLITIKSQPLINFAMSITPSTPFRVISNSIQFSLFTAL